MKGATEMRYETNAPIAPSTSENDEVQVLQIMDKQFAERPVNALDADGGRAHAVEASDSTQANYRRQRRRRRVRRYQRPV